MTPGLVVQGAERHMMALCQEGAVMFVSSGQWDQHHQVSDPW